ncbi:MAG: tyrosine-type recombinase/integrase [Acetobacteraceae bacterium]|nr:tyrosine-type recombinase/integrase [Acetobacteraceae bacterium]
MPTIASNYPELVAALEAASKDAVQVVVCETTKEPWRPDYFRQVFREVADAAGIPKTLQFRDLRATAATEAADGGADMLQLRTVHGWTTTQMAARYARPSQVQAKAAAATRHRGRRREQDRDV